MIIIWMAVLRLMLARVQRIYIEEFGILEAVTHDIKLMRLVSLVEIHLWTSILLIHCMMIGGSTHAEICCLMTWKSRILLYTVKILDWILFAFIFIFILLKARNIPYHHHQAHFLLNINWWHSKRFHFEHVLCFLQQVFALLFYFFSNFL